MFSVNTGIPPASGGWPDRAHRKNRLPDLPVGFWSRATIGNVLDSLSLRRMVFAELDGGTAHSALVA